MQSIIVVFNPGKLENADMDLRYSVPDRFFPGNNYSLQGC